MVDSIIFEPKLNYEKSYIFLFYSLITAVYDIPIHFYPLLTAYQRIEVARFRVYFLSTLGCLFLISFYEGMNIWAKNRKFKRRCEHKIKIYLGLENENAG
jgi:hypothetical protein